MMNEGVRVVDFEPAIIPGYGIEVINRVASHKPEVTFPGAEGAIRLRLAPAGHFAAQHWLSVSVEAGKFWLGLTPAGLDALVAPAIGSVPFCDLAEELGEAVVAVALSQWLEQIEAFSQFVPHLESAFSTPPEARLPRFGLYRNEGGGCYQWAEVAADASACRWLTTRLRALPPSGWDGRWDSLPIPLSLVLANMSFEQGELATLVPGDILLPVLQEPFRLRVQNAVDGRQLGVARHEDHSLIIEHWKEQTMTEQVQEDTPALATLEQLEVELRFELGRMCLPLAQLRELETGAVLPLEGDPIQPVSIFVNRQPAGRGEIVNIDDRLGIRITEWLGSDGP